MIAVSALDAAETLLAAVLLRGALVTCARGPQAASCPIEMSIVQSTRPSWRQVADPEPETFFLLVSKSFPDAEEFDPTYFD